MEDWSFGNVALDGTPGEYDSPGNDFNSPVLLSPPGVMAPVADWNFTADTGEVSPPWKQAPIGKMNYTFPGMDFTPYFQQGAFDVGGDDFNPNERPTAGRDTQASLNFGGLGDLLGGAARGAGDLLAGFGASPAYAGEQDFGADDFGMDELGLGAPAAQPSDSGASTIARAARAAGLDMDGTQVALAIAHLENGLTGLVGDDGNAFGPYQFHTAGMLPAYAASLGMSVSQAGEYARTHPEEAARWALQGYLGNAIKQGQQMGLSGANLATYVQQNGQRSRSPEVAGQTYNGLFGQRNVGQDWLASAGNFLAGLGAGTAYADEPEDLTNLSAEDIANSLLNEVGGMPTSGPSPTPQQAAPAPGSAPTDLGRDTALQSVLAANGTVLGIVPVPQSDQASIAAMLGQEAAEPLYRYTFQNGKQALVGSQSGKVYGGTALTALGAKPSLGTADAGQEAYDAFKPDQRPPQIPLYVWDAAARIARATAAQEGVSKGVSAGLAYLDKLLAGDKEGRDNAEEANKAKIDADSRVAVANIQKEGILKNNETELAKALLDNKQKDDQSKRVHDDNIANRAEMSRQFDLKLAQDKATADQAVRTAREQGESRERIAQFQAQSAAILKDKELAMQRYLADMKDASDRRRQSDQMKLEREKFALQKQLALYARSRAATGGTRTASAPAARATARRGPAPRSPYGMPEQWT